MKHTRKMISYGFVITMFTTVFFSFGCDARDLPLISEAESDFYGKLSILSSNFVPTALLPLEEFDNFSDNSSLRKIDRQCIEDSRHYVKALSKQSEWALSSMLKFISILIHVKT